MKSDDQKLAGKPVVRLDEIASDQLMLLNGPLVTLAELVQDLIDSRPLPAVTVTGLTLDSREVEPGMLFFAIAGSQQHGLHYVQKALQGGAVAVIYDPAGEGESLANTLAASIDVPLLPLAELSDKLGMIADRFYGHPSSALTVIGITGTNGKTSCSHFLARALNGSVIGTLGWGSCDSLQPLLNTTPDAITVHRLLAELQHQATATVAMEVSSHALIQGRCGGVRFQIALYTNFSRDHLDYHGSMAAYVEAKLQLLKQPGLTFAVINLDDALADQVLEAVPNGLRVIGYRRSDAQPSPVRRSVTVHSVRHLDNGLSFDVSYRDETATVTAPVIGDFNIDNLAAVLAVLLALGHPLNQAATMLQQVRAVPGRMELFSQGHGVPDVVVDYAHTPDALSRLLSSVRHHCNSTLWLLFGCGGDRDRGKRAEMGRVAEQLADRIVLSDDNPRSEAGDAIIAEISAGFNNSDPVEIIRDRTAAIRHLIEQAKPNDIIVVAGKGDEDYQEIDGVRHPFSDRAVVKQALLERSANQ